MDFEAYLLQTYGPSVAQRYHRIASRGDTSPRFTRPIRTERWVSNTVFRDKLFTPVQQAVIRSEYQAGLSCRDLATRWGVSQGTVANVVARRGTYK